MKIAKKILSLVLIACMTVNVYNSSYTVNTF